MTSWLRWGDDISNGEFPNAQPISSASVLQPVPWFSSWDKGKRPQIATSSAGAHSQRFRELCLNPKRGLSVRPPHPSQSRVLYKTQVSISCWNCLSFHATCVLDRLAMWQIFKLQERGPGIVKRCLFVSHSLKTYNPHSANKHENATLSRLKAAHGYFDGWRHPFRFVVPAHQVLFTVLFTLEQGLANSNHWQQAPLCNSLLGIH